MLLAFTAFAAFAPFARHRAAPDDMTQSLVTVVLFVLAILSIPFLLRRWQARRGGPLPGAAAGPGAKLVSVLAVGPQQRVVTIEVGPEGARTSLVLGVTSQSITCLHTASVHPPATEIPHA